MKYSLDFTWDFKKKKKTKNNPASSFLCREKSSSSLLFLSYESPLLFTQKLHFWSPSNALSPAGIPLNSDTAYLEQASDCRGEGLNPKRRHKSLPELLTDQLQTRGSNDHLFGFYLSVKSGSQNSEKHFIYWNKFPVKRHNWGQMEEMHGYGKGCGAPGPVQGLPRHSPTPPCAHQPRNSLNPILWGFHECSSCRHDWTLTPLPKEWEAGLKTPSF